MLLFCSEIELLFVDGAIIIFVSGFEVREVLNAENIKGAAACEVEIEMRLIEREHAIVEGMVYAIERVVYVNGAMAKGGIKLILRWPAGDDRDFGML